MTFTKQTPEKVIQMCFQAAVDLKGPIPSLKRLKQNQEPKSDNP